MLEPTRNRLRAAIAWMGPWAEKVRNQSDFEDFQPGHPGGEESIGSLANYHYYQKKLQCKGFDHYLHIFRDLYLETGWLPSEVFHLRDTKSQQCLTVSHDRSSFGLAACRRDDEDQRVHLANRIDTPAGGCCSG